MDPQQPVQTPSTPTTEASVSQPTVPQTPVPETTPPPPPPVEPQKSNKVLIVAIVLLLLAVLGAGGYFAFKYYQSTSQPVTQLTPSPSPTPDQLETFKGEISKEGNLNKYTNIGYKFEIKYPSNWELKENLEPTISSGGIITLSNDNNSLAVFPFEPGYGLENVSDFREEKLSAKVGTYTVEKIRWFSGNNILEEHILLKIDNSNFFFLMHYKDNKFNKEISNSFDQILSTFRFLK